MVLGPRGEVFSFSSPPSTLLLFDFGVIEVEVEFEVDPGPQVRFPGRFGVVGVEVTAVRIRKGEVGETVGGNSGNRRSAEIFWGWRGVELREADVVVGVIGVSSRTSASTGSEVVGRVRSHTESVGDEGGNGDEMPSAMVSVL